MKIHHLTLSLVAGMALLLSACTNKNSKIAASIQPNDSTLVGSDTTVLQVNQKLTDLARFIAGLPLSDSSELKALAETPVWKSYATEAERAWKVFYQRAEKYQAFSKKEIVAPYDTVKTLFYPFGGPDFLFANAMFPHVDKMILVGLETPGEIPHFANDSVTVLKKLINTYKSAIMDVIQLSFFRTNDMKNDSTSSFVGTTSVIMIFLARSGKQIDEVNPKKLDADGNLVNTNSHATAVQIKYHNKGENRKKSVIYLSTDLSDGALKTNKPFMNFLKKLDNNCLTFVKSATYLMHKSYFSIIRQTCLDKSTLILQDESGISYKYLNDGKWNIQLYGTYSKPIKMFSNHFQADYREAFQTSQPKPLDFRIGYDHTSNLLLAKKKKNSE